MTEKKESTIIIHLPLNAFKDVIHGKKAKHNGQEVAPSSIIDVFDFVSED